MTKNAERLLAQALKMVKLNGSFAPATVGKKIGLSRGDSEVAARALANAGLLVLGFDCDAQFTREFRKARSAKSAIH